jgi:endonuclease/exonuclease/phosphatase family metal-dependent hydrolase
LENALNIRTPCTTLGSAIILILGVGCQTLHNAHAPAIAFAAAAPPAIARANQVMSIDAAPAGAHGLTVLSYNMQRTQSLAELSIVADHLEADLERMPDFILCQEVMFSRSGNTEFGSSAEMLATRLGYFAQGSGRRTQREGLAIVSRHPFDFFEAKQLKARSLPLLGWPRVSLMAEFLVPGMGRVRVVDVHFTHNTGEHSMRARQLRETLAWVAQRERAVPADVTILGGDFNARPHWREMDLVNDAPPELDFDFLNFNGDEPTKRKGGTWKHRIDYIFAAAPLRELRFVGETLLWPQGLPNASGHGRFMPSDHLLVLHEYTVGPRARVAATE